ncbi:MAG: hypothetical protein KQH63_14685 [Desulfobulbaceae bacterium]|nr:hypothetical protein [Desulfobulbaceae bacterium]
MASRIYCSSVALELKALSEKLHKLSDGIDHIPSIDKYKLTPQIQDLHIIMTELDDRISSLMNECHIVEGPYEQEVIGSSFTRSRKQEKSGNEFFDYDFGG